MHNAIKVAAAILMSTNLTGCIVYDIRDNLVAINQSLDVIQEDLKEVQKTNEQLVGLDNRLVILDGMGDSLQRLDEHLLSLRKTIANIDSTIPFLKLSSESASEIEEDEAKREPQAPPQPNNDGQK